MIFDISCIQMVANSGSIVRDGLQMLDFRSESD